MFTEFINLNGFNDLLDIARHIENGHTQEALDSLRVPFDKGANAMAMFSMEFMLVDKESYQVGRYVDWYIKNDITGSGSLIYSIDGLYIGG